MSLSTETLLLPASCRTHTNEPPPRSGVGDSNVRGIGYIQTYTKLHDFTDAHWDDIYHLAQRDKLTPYVSHPLALHSLEPLESLQSMQGDVTHTHRYSETIHSTQLGLSVPQHSCISSL